METTDTTPEGIVDALLKPETPEASVSEEQAEPIEDDAAPVEQTAEADEDENAVDAEAETGEDVDDEEESEAAEESQTFKVKVDGQEQEVTLDELTRSYSGQKYIQKGMAEAAQKRKEAEAAFETLSVQAQQLNTLMAKAQRGELLTPPKKPDAQMLQKDPIGYFEQKTQYDDAIEAFNGERAIIQKAQNAAMIAQEQAQNAYLAEQAQKLQALVPEFADPVKGREVYDQMVAVSSAAYGFSADELAAVTDARHIQVLNDARKWQELQASKASITDRTGKTARPVLKGKAKTNANPLQVKLRQQQDKLRRTGSIEDAAALIFNPE